MFQKYPCQIEYGKTTVKDLSSEDIQITVQAMDAKTCFKLFEKVLEKK